MSPSPSPITIAGVAGWPVHHSLSPVLHNYWLKASKIPGAYTMFAVHPKEALYAFKNLKHTTISGLNVTIPLKAIANQAADIVTPEARNLGVCNLLYKRDGKLIGHNTDLDGFTKPLVQKVGHQFLANNTALVIGAGGAARAVLGSLLKIGVPEIKLLNRTNARAEALVRTINLPSLYSLPWRRLNTALNGVGLVINASAAGMNGKNNLDIDLSTMSPNGWVYDLVYTPQNTKLLVQAAQLSLGVIGGLDMLIEQARPSFQFLYGEMPALGLNESEMLNNYLRSK